MERENAVLVLRLGKERLQLVGLDKLHLMRDRWDEKRHSNAQWELHLILEGTCQVDLEDRRCGLKAGEALLIAPGQYHRPQTDPGPFQRLSLAFFAEEGTLPEQLHSCCPGSLVLTPGATLLQLGREILREHMARYSFRQTCLEAMLTHFMVELFRLLEVAESLPADTHSDKKQITGVIDAYFEAHFADAAGEQVLADRLHISRRQLVRILQEHYGMNFRQKLIHARMDYAGWLLRTTDTHVSKICSTVGYSSEAAFFKIFRQHFGMTPNQYRMNKR